MNDVLDLARYDPPHDVRRKQFVELVVRYLGQDTDEIREMATAMFGKEAWNPRWCAVLILRNILGPGQEAQVKEFAARFGFKV